ncbi:MAG TPA: tRNA-dihydrouridine synthase [Arthrobacter sp.]
MHQNTDSHREAARRAEPAITLPKETRTRTRKSAAVVLGISAILTSAVLTGCSPDGDVIDADYAQTCQDKTTQQRVDDDKCSDQGRSSGHYGWYFLPMGSSGSTSARSVPGVGSPLSGGITSIPSGATAKSGVSSKGASAVSRGGFGGSVKGGSIGG